MNCPYGWLINRLLYPDRLKRGIVILFERENQTLSLPIPF